MTLGELAAWMRRTGTSVHLRASGDRFVVVAHRELGIASDATGKDLESLLAEVVRDLDGRSAIPPEDLRPAPGKLRKRSEARRG